MRGQHARAHHLQHHDQGAATKSDDLQHRRPVRGRTRKKKRGQSRRPAKKSCNRSTLSRASTPPICQTR